ncbi:hypothetical protein PG993_012485 [Apiospora rasikravindrae]|uniref:Uncharacterized protein n=1 Tax=Apiospora rasikravindrae TaxID=990691 RepID=A0ABR1S2M0_9PEZI
MFKKSGWASVLVSAIPLSALLGFCSFLLRRLLKRQRDNKEQRQGEAVDGVAAGSGRGSGIYVTEDGNSRYNDHQTAAATL